MGIEYDPIKDIEMGQEVRPGVPSTRQQSWGLLVSIVVIVLMITIGAFYAWGKRIAEQQAFINQTNAAQQQ